MTRWAKTVNPSKCYTEYPRPQMVRGNFVTLNGLWNFHAQGVEKNQILVPFPVESALSGIGKALTPGTEMVYDRVIPGGKKGSRTLLHFEAVDHDATVEVNGHELAHHSGGYDAFTVDITNALQAGENHLKVTVVDKTADFQPGGKQSRRPSGIWYTPCSGIWQSVWMEHVPETFISSYETTSNLQHGIQSFVVRTNTPHQPVTVEVMDKGTVVGTVKGKAGETLNVHLTNPKVWGPGHPHLYDIKITAGKDSVKGYFGFRDIKIAKDEKGVNRIMLNGKPVFCAGPLDQGFWPDGIYTAPTDAAMKWDITETLKYGFNTIRKHVKVEPQRFYHYCDQLGMLVWQDFPSPIIDIAERNTLTPEEKAQYLKELEAMIAQHQNSPSIIMWVPFNEGWGQHDTEAVVAQVHEWDPTRLINNASGWTDKKVGSVMDIHHYPNPSAPATEAHRAAVLGEFGGLGLPVTGHTWVDKNWGYIGMADTKELTERFIDYWREVRSLKEDHGLCAAIYTQTTDVETECNGLMTYDREIHKIKPEDVAKAVRGELKPIRWSEVIPTGQTWHYTTDTPSQDWVKGDTSSWKTGKGGFGSAETPGVNIGTTWDSADIWMKTDLTLSAKDIPGLYLKLFHDEDAEIYVNGVQVLKRTSYVTSYVVLELSAEFRKALKPGVNHIAVHCHQTRGGQGIDLGFVKRSE